MYTPPAFRMDELTEMQAAMRACGLASLVTATGKGLMATPLPLYLEPGEGVAGTLYGHVARANPQWSTPALGEAMAIFSGPNAYISPSWYATKAETGKVVPTWNYVAVHAHGPVDFFDDAGRLLEVVTRLTRLHEGRRDKPWAVADAPADYVAAQLKGIVGLRLPIVRLEGKRKMSQNRPAADREGVARGLGGSDSPADRAVAGLIPR
jgi:transcriptional regulator